jgi:hypothetical protein
MSSISDVISRFDNLEQALKSVFSKVDPRTVVSLIMQERKVENPLYTVETIVNPGQNTDAISLKVCCDHYLKKDSIFLYKNKKPNNKRRYFMTKHDSIVRYYSWFGCFFDIAIAFTYGRSR